MSRPQGEGGSPFDLMQSSMMNVIFAQFGYMCSWNPLAGGPTQTARVGFKDPTKSENVVINLQYEILDPEIEYKFGDFVGLEESARKTTQAEYVTVHFANGNDVRYMVRKITAKYDGKTYIAKLQKQN